MLTCNVGRGSTQARNPKGAGHVRTPTQNHPKQWPVIALSGRGSSIEKQTPVRNALGILAILSEENHFLIRYRRLLVPCRQVKQRTADALVSFHRRPPQEGHALQD